MKYKARATAEERSTVGRKPAKCDDKRTNLWDSKDSSLQNNVVRRISRQSCEATNRNVIEAQRDPEVSCPWTAKPFPTDSGVDDELVQRKFTFLFGEICERIRESSLLQSGPRDGNIARASRRQQRS